MYVSLPLYTYIYIYIDVKGHPGAARRHRGDAAGGLLWLLRQRGLSLLCFLVYSFSCVVSFCCICVVFSVCLFKICLVSCSLLLFINHICVYIYIYIYIHIHIMY